MTVLRRSMLRSVLIAVGALCLTAITHAVTVGKTELPDSWPLDSETLILNGAGLREYSFLRIAVYAGALYLPARETDAKKILDATTPRVIHMKMLRDVNRDNSIKAWTHYLEANCKAPCEKDAPAFKAALSAFQAATPETKSADTQTFIFHRGEATWLRNGKPIAEFRDAAFTRALLACWIGEVPTTAALRSALLGSSRP
jgi:Chalcone isomerase-like